MPRPAKMAGLFIRMQSDSPFFDADAIRATTFVRHVEVHDELDSTNNRAAELAGRLPADDLPALIVARRQTAGRGRGRNLWWSADGGLTFSLLIESADFGIGTANWPQLSLATAIAVCDALKIGLDLNDERADSHLRLGIKWPNDVLIDGGKVCGILIESPGGAAPAKDRLIVGIGINVNNSWRSAPKEAGPDGTALCDVTGRSHDLQEVLTDTLRAMAARIDQLRNRDPKLIQASQERNLLAGQSIIVEADGRRIEGECVDIADDGALVVDSIFGRQRLYSGTVRMVR